MTGIPGLLLFGALAALANLFGGLLLASSGAHRREAKLLKYLVALGAGFMLAAIFIEIVPETVGLWTSDARGASATEAVVGAFTLLLGGYLLIQLFEHTVAPHFHFGAETHPESVIRPGAAYTAIGGLTIHTGGGSARHWRRYVRWRGGGSSFEGTLRRFSRLCFAVFRRCYSLCSRERSDSRSKSYGRKEPNCFDYRVCGSRALLFASSPDSQMKKFHIGPIGLTGLIAFKTRASYTSRNGRRACRPARLNTSFRSRKIQPARSR